jgi:iron complex transport system substrate-binding protein
MRSSFKIPSFLLGIIIASLLSACGASTAPAAQPTAAAVVPTAEPTTAPTAEPTAEATEEATAEPVANTGECAAGFRLFEHDVLVGDPVCVPENPQRIVALDMAAVETVLLSGKVPVGSASWLLSEMPVSLPQFADVLAEVTPLGYPAELETIASLKPDLILATPDSIDVELASAIAPIVVASADIYTGWQNGMGFWAAALGEEELYAEMEANYNARVAELQGLLEDRAEAEVSIISATSTSMSIWLPNTPPGSILEQVGISRPEAQSVTGDAALAMHGADSYIPVTLENIDIMDGKSLFLFTYSSSDPELTQTENAALEALQAEPLWQSMQATKNGKVFVVPGYWWRAQTYYLANFVIDDLYKYLADATPSIPVLEIK